MLLIDSGTKADQTIDYLLSREVTPVFFDSSKWMQMNLQVSRYVRYGEILRASEVEYDRVLLTDVCDVVFQGHPFQDAPEGRILCFQEDGSTTIGQSMANCVWIDHIFGAAGVAIMKNRPISCSGTTIGTHEGILQYIDRMMFHATPEKMAKIAQYRGHDQGIHNYMLGTGQLPGAVLLPNGNHVYTVAKVPDQNIRVASGGIVLTVDQKRCPIVHQYTYKPVLKTHVEAAYPFSQIANK